MNKILIAAVPVLAITGWLVLRPEAAVSINMTTVDKGTVEALVANTRSGTVRACNRSRLSLAMGGQVSRLYVKQGDKAEAGALLLELWNDDLKAAQQQALAQVRIAELTRASSCRKAEADARELERQRELFRNKLSSAEQLDRIETSADMSRLTCQQADAQITQAKANAAVQQARLAQTQLRAPFAGIVAEVNGEVGEYATPSPPGVATPPAIDLIDDSCLYVRAPIDEVDAATIQVGMPARITLDAFRQQAFTGSVSRIAPYVQDLERQARTVDVDVVFDNLPDNVRLLVGYSADIEVITDIRHDTLRVPTEALLEGNQVLTLNSSGERLHKQALTLGLSNWTWTEVLEGLSAGQAILTVLDNPAATEGALVQVKIISDSRHD